MNYQELLEKLRVDLMIDRPSTPPTLFWSVVIAVCILAFFFWFLPVWGVWKSRKSGEASLAEANFAEQVAIAQASARLKAAEMNKQAEVIEAESVSLSMKTIGNALQDNEGYLRYLWIKMMEQNNAAAVYVPTEGNLPILEAGKRSAGVVSE